MRRLLATLFLLVVTALPVNAHSSLVSATPAENAVLTEFPTEVSLTFNENLLTVGEENPNRLEVFNSMGDLLSSASVINGPVITAPVQISGNDNYRVSYRVVSQDGHVIKGEYSFAVESEIATAVPISEPVEAPEDGSNLLVRGFMLLVFIGAIILLRKAVS